MTHHYRLIDMIYATAAGFVIGYAPSWAEVILGVTLLLTALIPVHIWNAAVSHILRFRQ